MKRYDETNFPPAMQSLDKGVRRRAVEETNRLLEFGYASGRATSMGIARAQEGEEHPAKRNGADAIPAMHVMFIDHQWVIWPEDQEEPTHRFNVLEDAFRRAHQLAVEHGANLYVFGPAGELIEKSEMHGATAGDGETIHVAPYEGHWVAQKTGPERFFMRFDHKREAVQTAREKAKELGARLIIRYQTGEIQEQHDYHAEH